VRTHHRKTKISDRGNILMFDKGVGLDLRNEPQRRAPSQLIEAERMSAIGRMTCSISHDMRHSLTAIYANARREDVESTVHVANKITHNWRMLIEPVSYRSRKRECLGNFSHLLNQSVTPEVGESQTQREIK